jgi:hypothetical protein
LVDGDKSDLVSRGILPGTGCVLTAPKGRGRQAQENDYDHLRVRSMHDPPQSC